MKDKSTCRSRIIEKQSAQCEYCLGKSVWDILRLGINVRSFYKPGAIHIIIILLQVMSIDEI